MVTAGLEPLLLDTQYRMHPLIAEIPSQLFYQGRLKSGATVGDILTLNCDVVACDVEKPSSRENSLCYILFLCFLGMPQSAVLLHCPLTLAVRVQAAL